MEGLDELRRHLPEIRDWVARYLDDPRHLFGPVDVARFQRLPAYFPPSLLARTRVAVLGRLELPPFRVLGARFRDLEDLWTVLVAVNYEGRIFILEKAAHSESAYILPLVRSVQWEALGTDLFLLAYFATFAENDFRWNPFIEMAHRVAAAFDRGEPLPDLEQTIAEESRQIAAPYRSLV